jgi:hypothetical protein
MIVTVVETVRFIIDEFVKFALYSMRCEEQTYQSLYIYWLLNKCQKIFCYFFYK